MRKRGSLLGTMARTAVIVKTAEAVSGSNKQAPAAAPAEPAPAAAPAAAGGMTEEKIALLQKLTELQTAGVLTAEEFAAEKAKILNG